MRVFVINLAQHADRRESAAEKLKSLAVNFEFFEAVSGDDAVRDGVFAEFDSAEFALNTGRAITPGEVGCFASHRALWAKCSQLDKPIMIMEDDFDLLDGFADALHCAEKITGQLGFLRLQTGSGARTRPITGVDGFQVSRYTKAPFQTLCYSISPAAAHCFLKNSRSFVAPVDVFIRQFWEHGQPLYGMTPYTVTPSAMSVDTTITGRIKDRTKFRLRLGRMLHKGSLYTQRWFFNVRQHDASVWQLDSDLQHMPGEGGGGDQTNSWLR